MGAAETKRATEAASFDSLDTRPRHTVASTISRVLRCRLYCHDPAASLRALLVQRTSHSGRFLLVSSGAVRPGFLRSQLTHRAIAAKPH
jgi:hypothetical protein